MANIIRIRITIDTQHFVVESIQSIYSKKWEQKIETEVKSISHSSVYTIILYRKLTSENLNDINKDEYLLAVTIKCIKSTPSITLTAKHQASAKDKLNFGNEWADFTDENINIIEDKTSLISPLTGFIDFSVQFIKPLLKNNDKPLQLNKTATKNSTKSHLQTIKSTIGFPIHSSDPYYAIVPIVKVIVL